MERETCTYCERPATWRIEGYVEGPTDSGYTTAAARNPVCGDHKREFEEWDRDADTYLHGFVSVTAFIPIAVR